MPEQAAWEVTRIWCFGEYLSPPGLRNTSQTCACLLTPVPSRNSHWRHGTHVPGGSTPERRSELSDTSAWSRRRQWSRLHERTPAFYRMRTAWPPLPHRYTGLPWGRGTDEERIRRRAEHPGFVS